MHHSTKLYTSNSKLIRDYFHNINFKIKMLCINIFHKETKINLIAIYKILINYTLFHDFKYIVK